MKSKDELRAELEEYAESTFGEREILDCDDDEENPAPSVSNFRQIWEFPLLYQWACYLIYVVPIHQQQVEHFFQVRPMHSQARLEGYPSRTHRPIPLGRTCTDQEVGRHEQGDSGLWKQENS